MRPCLSEKNQCWLEKHRYYELKHFCLQYPIWKKAYSALDGLSHRPVDREIFSKTPGDPTFRCAAAREFYSTRIQMIERAARVAGEDLSDYILKAVTEGCSYGYLRTALHIPCGKDMYYSLYRRFFWILSKERQ